MTNRFHSFVILGGMRTGSNFLEANLNALKGVRCLGEAFNPHFIGDPKKKTLLGMNRLARDDEPLELLERMSADPGLVGFRYFHDHDARVFPAIMEDPGCAKIVLMRNPLDSYVSLGIARLTDQWRLTEARGAMRAQMHFDASDFSRHLAEVLDFRARIRLGLQVAGQAGFLISYEDLGDLDVLNGLAAWLGIEARLDHVNKSLKRQNTVALDEKVSNYDEMLDELSGLDISGARALFAAEPARSPVVPSYIIAAKAPLLYQPLRAGPVDAVSGWLNALDGDQPNEGYNRSSLRSWQRANPGHKAFTVLRHPLARAHAAFCEKILPHKGDAYLKLRPLLREAHDVPLPKAEPGPDYDHAAAFRAFLSFVVDNLEGRSALRVDPVWASQTAIIAGFAKLRAPDLLIREHEMASELPRLAQSFGYQDVPQVSAPTDPNEPRLAAIYDRGLESLCRKAYRRDYESFGYSDWSPVN